MSVEEEIGKYLISNKLTISTAESCTGGLLSSKLTDVPGSSNYVTYNVVTYSNAIKNSVLNVTEFTLENYGAVSPECAREMVQGLKALTGADICVSTTGIAGPGGGTPQKPVGLCYTAVLFKDNITVERILLAPDIPRKQMKEFFADKTLLFIKKILQL